MKVPIFSNGFVMPFRACDPKYGSLNAFDTVPHAKLIWKQTALNIPPHLVSWISSYLYSRKQQVVVSGAYSATVDVTSGVPQGSVLGPLLFLIYVDGLAEMPMHGGSLIMFADDALLYKVVQSITDFQDLQSDVSSFVQWTADHDLKLKVKKCKSLLLSRRRVPVCTHTIVSGGFRGGKGGANAPPFGG